MKKIILKVLIAILTFKRMSERMEKIGQNKLSSEEDKQSDLITEYEKAQNMMKVIITQHKSLREKHEEFFHEMMGH